MADPEAKDQYHNHKKGTTEIFDGKYESPDDDVLIFFIKLSQQWKGIWYRKHPKQKDYSEKYHKKTIYAGTAPVAHPNICYQKEPKQKKRDTEKNSLLKILFKGTEKIPGYRAAFAARQIYGGIVTCSGGWPYGKNRNTADKPEGIEYKDIKNIPHFVPERGVLVKKFI